MSKTKTAALPAAKVKPLKMSLTKPSSSSTKSEPPKSTTMMKSKTFTSGEVMAVVEAAPGVTVTAVTKEAPESTPVETVKPESTKTAKLPPKADPKPVSVAPSQVKVVKSVADQALSRLRKAAERAVSDTTEPEREAPVPKKIVEVSATHLPPALVRKAPPVAKKPLTQAGKISFSDVMAQQQSQQPPAATPLLDIAKYLKK